MIVSDPGRKNNRLVKRKNYHKCLGKVISGKVSGIKRDFNFYEKRFAIFLNPFNVIFHLNIPER